nr:leucine aminopeptidase 1-like [Ipomoea batatas]
MANSVAMATLGLTKPNQIQRPKISFAAREVDLLEWKGDILAVGVTEKDMARDQNSKFQNLVLQKLDSNLGGMLSKASSEDDFSGKSGQSTVLRLSGLGFKRIGLVGFGSSVSSTTAYRTLGETIAAAAKSAQASSVAVALASAEGLSVESKLSAASAMATGIVLGTFEDNSSGVIFVKELVNAPANVLTPGVLAEEAKNIASLYSDVLTATILDAEQCKELKMGSFLGVAAASAHPPNFIHLCYKPPSGSVKTKLALVGKGITFDSGGYNIKAGANSAIEIMKNDMGGAAVVFAAAKAMGQLKPDGVEVHFLTAACENMISGAGMRPGDILTASNGKRIEVNNTDAEGRLALADTLIYACKLGVEKIVDLATLTGACITALGPSVAGVFTPSDELAREVLEAAQVGGEKLWRLPMEESYWGAMKSGIADMINTGPRHGGAITAALFLKQFVDEGVEWLHIDIAGPVFDEKKKLATGFGISTMVEWVLKHSS